MEERDHPPRRRRKLLVASIGVATVSYAMFNMACEKVTSGNLPAPEPTVSPVTGNLPAPPPQDAASEPTPTTTTTTTAAQPSASGPTARPPISGNLPAPPPRDAGTKK